MSVYRQLKKEEGSRFFALLRALAIFCRYRAKYAICIHFMQSSFIFCPKYTVRLGRTE